MKNRVRSFSGCSSGSLSSQNTNTPDVDRSVADVLFGPILTMFKYSGLYIDRNRCHKGFLYYLHFGLSIVYLLAVTMDNGRMFMYLGKEGGSSISGKIMVFASVMFFNVFLNFLSVAMFVVNSLYLNTFLTEFAKYSTKYGLGFDVNKLKSKIRITIIVICVVSTTLGVPITFGCWYYLLNYWPGTIMEAFVYPFYAWSNLPKYMFLFIEIALRSVLFHQFDAVCILYYVICYIIWKEYKGINAKLKDIIDKQTFNEFESIRRKHETITRLLAEINPILQHLMFSVYASGIPMICLTIFGLVGQTLIPADVVVTSQFFIWTSVSMSLLTGCGVMINSVVSDKKVYYF